MAQNTVFPNKDNKVVFVFSGVDLTLATNIVVNFGSETYSLSDSEVTVASATELALDLSGTAEVGKIYATITYFDAGSVNGEDITSRELGNSDQIIVAIGTQLIIEDGSIVEYANSFVTDAEFKNYADIRNIDIPATQPDREALLILAMDYIVSVESKLRGCRVDYEQELPYPRIGATINCFSIPSNTIHKNVKSAQMELAAQAHVSDLLINESSQNVAREKLGDLETEYFQSGAWSTVRTDRADAYLLPLMEYGGNSNRMNRGY